MYEEKYRKKERNQRPRRTFRQWLGQLLIKLFALALTLGIALAGLLYVLPPALFAVEPEGMELALSDSLPHTCVNVLLLGTDAMHQGMQRSDTIMIASIGFGTFKLTSILRDTMVEIDGHGRQKLNAAFAYGGPELAMRTINQNFGLNIMHYARADYAALVRIVDAIGGIQVNVSEAELKAVNELMQGAAEKLTSLGYTVHLVTQAGESVRVDGLQALAYARIRSIDDDYMRTRRQRRVLAAIALKLRNNLWNPRMLSRFSRAVAESVETNMSPVMMLSLGEKALMTGIADTLRLPTDETKNEKGSKLDVQDYAANHNAFVRFVYGGGQ